jgi:hypothetical protein
VWAIVARVEMVECVLESPRLEIEHVVVRQRTTVDADRPECGNRPPGVGTEVKRLL